jgi:DNA-binding transcriptional MerR regulator
MRCLNAGEAARRLGVSAKALRLYEEHGLVVPDRSRAGWRNYGPADMERAAEIVSLRRLGLGLAEIAKLLASPSPVRDGLLAAHRSDLQSRMRTLGAQIQALGEKRSKQAMEGQREEVAFDLPWPWGGERFAVPVFASLTFITGPLGSGKTRFARRLAGVLPNGRFLGLDRLEQADSHMARLEVNGDLTSRHRQMLDALAAYGATMSVELSVLVVALCSASGPLVVDMVEQGLDTATQQALMKCLRQRRNPVNPLILMTRSSAILDLGLAESDETILYCPANHAPPMVVRRDPLCPGHEAVVTCLASPEVRARTAGVAAIRMGYDLPVAGDSRETLA